MTIQPNRNSIVYEGVNYYEYIKGKIGKNTQFEKDNELADIRYWIKNGGFALYTFVEIYFLRVNSELQTSPKLIQVDLHIPKGLMYIEKVYPCIDPALIVIELLELEKHIFIVWDVEANKEIYNYSTSQNSKFIVGCGSKAGYLELEDCIVDLDTKIVDYNFKVKYKYLSQGYMYNLMSKGNYFSLIFRQKNAYQ